jgi:hypothetical protein
MATADMLRSEKQRVYEYVAATQNISSTLIITPRGLGETVTVLSKDGKALAVVHKELLGAQSDYLAEHLQALTLALPFDEEVVAKSFVYWLYRQRIHIPHAVRDTSLDSLTGSYGLLSKLWVLADKYHMKSLANDVVDGVWDLYLANEYLPYSAIEFIYQNTSTPLSAIRRLLVTIMEFCMSTRDIDHLREVLPGDFFVDLLRKKFDEPDEKYSMAMRKDFCKRFHEHDYMEEGEQFSECVGVKACD